MAMTTTAALKEAKRRFGPNGALDRGPDSWALPCSVGVNVLGLFATKGQGRTWEDAFSDADRIASLTQK